MWSYFAALTLISAASVSGTFYPVSFVPQASSLEARELQSRECLQPTSSVDLHYIEEYAEDIPYVVRMRASHDKSGYVAVETFEHLLTGLTCSSPSQDDVSNLTFAFDTAQSFNDAQTAWSNHGDLLFVTHHATCNEAETRAVYKSSAISYDLSNLTITVTARRLKLDGSPAASSSLHIQGGSINTELRRKLRRRRNLEDYVAREKRQQVRRSHWVLDLSDYKFDKRESIIAFDQLNLTCVDCALKGKVDVSFELDINFNDLNIFNNGDGNPFNSAKVQLRVMEAVDADFNIEVQAGLKGSVEASFPGVKNGNYRQGKNFQPGPTRPSDIGDITFNASLSLGIAVGLNWQASGQVTFPISVDVPAGNSVIKDFFNDSADSYNLAVNPTFRQPIFRKEDITARICGSVALGPAVVLGVSTKEFGVTASARLDLPRVDLCVALAQNVDSECANGGPFAAALQLSATFGVGLRASIVYMVGKLTKTITATPQTLYKTWPKQQVCFGVSGSSNKGDKIQPSGPPTNGGQPEPGSIPLPVNGPSGGNSTSGKYDCAGIAPLPGGQPCGNVVMQCLDTSRWSCGNGQQGIVPPGTFCACGAFRYPGWQPPTAVSPSCTTGITCVSETMFSICSAAGIEPPQAVSSGTKCRNGAIVAG